MTKIFFFDGGKREGEYNVPQGGGVAQLGEHHVRNVGVEGSIPFSSTTFVFPFRSSVFLIGRETIALSRFLPGVNRLPRPRTARVSRMDTEIGFRIFGRMHVAEGPYGSLGNCAATHAILRPLVAGSTRRTFLLAQQAAGIQGDIPSDPGIRGPLHPPRHRCPPSPYRCGYALVRRLAGCGASTLSVLGLFRNGPLDAGHPPLCRWLPEPQAPLR